MSEQLMSCRRDGCSARVFFARTISRRALMPLEPDPVPASDVPPPSRWSYDPQELSCAPVRDAASPTRVYIPHWGTCPGEIPRAPTNATLRALWEKNGGTP